MVNRVRIFSSTLFTNNISLVRSIYKQFCKTDEPVTLLLKTRMLISFLNDVDIQRILEFKNSCGKYHSVFPKNP